MKTTTYVLRFEAAQNIISGDRIVASDGGTYDNYDREYPDLDIAQHAMMDILANPHIDKLKRFSVVGTIGIFERVAEETLVETREVKK